jgi:hypothetical protein
LPIPLPASGASNDVNFVCAPSGTVQQITAAAKEKNVQHSEKREFSIMDSPSQTYFTNLSVAHDMSG